MSDSLNAPAEILWICAMMSFLCKLNGPKQLYKMDSFVWTPQPGGHILLPFVDCAPRVS